MGNTLRCCLACVLPCGSLDLIRVVHINGHVDKYSRPLPASDVLAAHPDHVLTAPSSHCILLVSPDAHLQRGHIYFLIPASSHPASRKNKHKPKPRAPESRPAPEAGACERRQHRKGAARVGVWRPHLQSITEEYI